MSVDRTSMDGMPSVSEIEHALGFSFRNSRRLLIAVYGDSALEGTNLPIKRALTLVGKKLVHLALTLSIYQSGAHVSRDIASRVHAHTKKPRLLPLARKLRITVFLEDHTEHRGRGSTQVNALYATFGAALLDRLDDGLTASLNSLLELVCSVFEVSANSLDSFAKPETVIPGGINLELAKSKKGLEGLEDTWLLRAIVDRNYHKHTLADNRLLAFFGDRILALLVALLLPACQKRSGKGTLSFFGTLNTNQSLTKAVEQRGLSDILLGDPCSNPSKRQRQLGTLAEALVAAFYFSQGASAAMKFTSMLLEDELRRLGCLSQPE